MKKIDKYILKSYIKSISIGIFAFLDLYILSDLFRMINKLVQKQLPPMSGILSIVYFIPSHLIAIAPIGVLIGALFFTSKMASSLEIISLKSSGVSLKRIMMWPLIVTGILTILFIYLNAYIVPISTNISNTYARRNGKQIISPIRNNIYLRNKNYYMYIQEANVNTNTLQTVEIVKLSKKLDTIDTIYTANAGIFSKGMWILKNGTTNNLITKKLTNFSSLNMPILKLKLKSIVRYIPQFPDLTATQLRHMIPKYQGDKTLSKKMLIYLYDLFLYPLSIIIISLLGFSLGSRFVRGGTAISIAVAVIVGYTYYTLTSVFSAFALKINNIPILFFLLIPSLIFLIAGIYLMNRSEY